MRPLTVPHRYKGAKGGRAGMKSHFFGENLAILATRYPGIRACCIREVQKSIKRSSKLLIEDKIEQLKLTGFRPLREEIVTPGKGIIIFQGMKDHTAESIKSLEGFDVFWFEEANKASDGSIRILRPTARSTKRSRLKVPELWFSWNATLPTDPVDVFFKDKPPDSVCVHTTYRDNPWLPQELVAEIEWDRRRDPEKYRHVWEGDYLSRSDSRVFNNWRVDEFDVPRDITLYWGSDWGFSVDPSVLVGCFIVGRTLFVAYEAYKVGCEIDHLPALFDKADPERKGLARAWSITADSARADTISYMKRNGYPGITSARKGAGSVEDGIEFLKNYDIVVHPDCVHTIDELTHYSYKVDKLTDKVLPILKDEKNHVIDALRYALEDVRWAVAGDSEAAPSDISRRYDGSISITTTPVAPAVEDIGNNRFSGAAFDGHQYDGGLT